MCKYKKVALIINLSLYHKKESAHNWLFYSYERITYECVLCLWTLAWGVLTKPQRDGSICPICQNMFAPNEFKSRLFAYGAVETGSGGHIGGRLRSLRSAHNLLWQFIPIRDYSNAESVLAATGFTPLLVSFESMTSKPNAGGAAKTVSHGKLRRSPWILLRTRERCRSRWRAVSDVAQTFYKLHPKFFEILKSREWMGDNVCIAH